MYQKHRYLSIKKDYNNLKGDKISTMQPSIRYTSDEYLLESNVEKDKFPFYCNHETPNLCSLETPNYGLCKASQEQCLTYNGNECNINKVI